MKTLVLCAGKSTRIASIGKGVPKPLIEIGGKSVLSRNLYWLSQAGFREIWINLHHRPEEIQNHVGDGSRFGISVKYSFEPEILGTAGAVKNLSSEWKNTFLVVYGDNLFNFSLDAFYRSYKAPATLALFDRKLHLHTGIAGGQVVLSGSRIEGFIEGSAQEISPYVNAGAYFLEPIIVDSIPQGKMFDFGKDLFPLLLKRGMPLNGHVIDGYCLGIDTPESYHTAVNLLESQ